MTVGMVSLMLGGGFCGFGYCGIFSLFFGISCSRRVLICLRGFLLCVHVRERGLRYFWRKAPLLPPVPSLQYHPLARKCPVPFTLLTRLFGRTCSQAYALVSAHLTA